VIFVERVPLPPGARLRWHGHASGHLCLVEGGAFVERVARRREACGPGTVRLSRPGTEHDLTAGAFGARCTLLEFPGTWLEYSGTASAPSLFVQDAACAAGLVAALDGNGPDRDFRVESAFWELAATFARRSRLRGPGGAPPWLRRVRDRLAVPEEAPPALRALAREEGVHPAHLARAFREHFGLTAGEWSRRARLDRARHLVTATDRPLAAIAAELGFSDQAHLTRRFRARYGVPPGRARRLVDAYPVQDASVAVGHPGDNPGGAP